MTELTDAWAVWRKLTANGGERTKQVLEAETNVHVAQKKIGTPPYDFTTKYWEKKEIDGTSTVSGPPMTDAKPDPSEIVPQSNFDFNEAKTITGDDDYAIFEFCNRLVEAWITCITHIAQQTNSINKTNHARRGQSINQTLDLFKLYRADPSIFDKYKKEK